MISKLSLRLRLTLMNIALLAACCLVLALVLNRSANTLADVIEAIPMSPATTFTTNEVSQPAQPLLPSTTSQVARDYYLYQSLLVVVVIVLIGGLLTYFLSKKGLEPLSSLSQKMKEKTVSNLNVQLPEPKTNDEIANLTKSFNQMSSTLDTVFMMQKRFSQSVAHELRTPLTIIKTKIDVFNKRENHSTKEFQSLIDSIGKQTNRLSALVKELLDLTHMDVIELSEQIHLTDVIEDILLELHETAQQKSLTIDFIPSEITLIGNLNLLYRALFNLIENAIKYNHQDGQIYIALAQNKDQTTITISDTGIGISEKSKALIFEPFFREDNSRSREMGGVGLGLTMVKSIIEKHHGAITVVTYPNTCFVISLPNYQANQ